MNIKPRFIYKLYFSARIIGKPWIKNNEIFGYALEDPNKQFNSYEGNVMVTSEYVWFTKEASELRVELWVKKIIEFLSLIKN